MNNDNVVSFGTYEVAVLDDFIEQYPEYENDRLEVTEQGKVYVHGNSAYPLIIKHAPSYKQWLKTL